jgi:hypothetical protein
MCAHTLGFVELKRAGMSLLLGHAHGVQYIENGLALYFQLSR